jgi:hypothetical protein
MRIDGSNYSTGNRAMAWSLLLYYHLLNEEGITFDQTVYIDPEEFDAFTLCEVEIAPEYSPEMDGQLIREGAIIHILCDLNDFIGEYEDDFLKQPFIKKAVSAYERGQFSAIPEAGGIFELMAAGEANFNYSAYKAILANIFTKYVVAKFKGLVHT